MFYHNKFNNQSGFTLLEVLLSIIIIGILVGVSIPVYQSFQVKNSLDLAVNAIAQSLRRAQALAQAIDGDSSWGVKIQSGSIILFKGNDYSSRDSNFDEMFDLPTNIDSSGGLQEIVFTKFLGEPITNGSIVLTTAANQTKIITINEKGMVDY